MNEEEKLLNELQNNLLEVSKNKRTIYNNVTKNKEYQIYHQMIQRCYNPNHPKYKNYGGRGIIICDKWMNKINGYENFINDMGYRNNEEDSIDRINVNGNYEPNNCKWSSSKEQSFNKTTSIKIIPGEKLNNLTIIEEISEIIPDKKFRRTIKVKCDCGNEKIIRYDKFKSGKIKTCGSKNCKHNGPHTKLNPS